MRINVNIDDLLEGLFTSESHNMYVFLDRENEEVECLYFWDAIEQGEISSPFTLREVEKTFRMGGLSIESQFELFNGCTLYLEPL